MVTWLGHYWASVGANIEAMPLEALVTVVVGLVLRKPVSRLWRRIVGEKADIEDLKRAAAAAQRIAADLFEHHTGERHHAAPDDGKGER